MSLAQRGDATDTGRSLQPALHELAICLRAPTLACSSADGQVRGHGAEGLLHGDVRVLSRAVVRVNGFEPEAISSARQGVDGYRFTGLLRALGDAGPDPTVRLDRVRTVVAGGCTERLALSSTATEPVPVEVEVEVAADFSAIDVLKAGRANALVSPERHDDDTVRWQRGGTVSHLTFVAPVAGATLELNGESAVWRWRTDLAPRTDTPFGWTVEVQDPGGTVMAAPTGHASWSTPVVHVDDRRMAAWLEASLQDLSGLRMVTADRPEDVFVAAGTPWYFTLFGRDSLWAARMALPLGTELAAGTLRTLAARQGTAHDRPSQQQPGKILHELRRAATVVDDTGAHLPSSYYGTVDATPLWVCLLHDAWRWGMPADQVTDLLPAARAALDWLLHWADPDGDHLVEYVDSEGTGLANQGWKDSGDSIRFVDGSVARPPIALAEVQGYAHEALVRGSDLLEAFGDTSTEPYRRQAALLRTAFSQQFWVTDETGSFPALALDAGKARVDTLTSNIGHLLGTGIVGADEEAEVARRLNDPTMSSGFGLRTMSSAAGGYSALSYHCGSVWPHDTAIVLLSLARAGLAEQGRDLVEGLLAAAAAFDYRLPELWSGDAAAQVGRPVPYPAACRPQAWSVTSAVAVLRAVLGLEVDVPAGTARLRPMRPCPVGRLRVEGLVVGGSRVLIEVDGAGTVLRAEGGDLTWLTA